MKKVIIATVFLIMLFQSSFAQEALPAINSGNKSSFYIPNVALKNLKMKPGTGDDWMKLYNADTDVLNAATRINDIRWQASNKNEAGIWVLMNGKLLAEDGDEVTNPIAKPKGVIAWNVYGLSKELMEINASLGLQMTLFNFVFTVDKYVGKIVISGNAKMTIQDAYKIAKTGIDATIKAAKKK